MIFINRVEAGVRLANALMSYKGQNVVVFALPRGGVVLGVEIAKALDAKLDLIVVRKIGHPDAPEYAIAAIADDGHGVENAVEVRTIDMEWFEKACDFFWRRRYREGWFNANKDHATALVRVRITTAPLYREHIPLVHGIHLG